MRWCALHCFVRCEIEAFHVRAGLSGRTQVLFALVFTTRYLDLFTNFVSLYNSLMKIFYLVSSYTTVYLMHRKFKASYDRCDRPLLIVPL